MEQFSSKVMKMDKRLKKEEKRKIDTTEVSDRQ